MEKSSHFQVNLDPIKFEFEKLRSHEKFPHNSRLESCGKLKALSEKKKVFKSEEQEEEQKCEKGITKALSLGQTFELGEKCEIIRCKRAKNSKSIVIIENSFENFTLNQGFISLTL